MNVVTFISSHGAHNMYVMLILWLYNWKTRNIQQYSVKNYIQLNLNVWSCMWCRNARIILQYISVEQLYVILRQITDFILNTCNSYSNLQYVFYQYTCNNFFKWSDKKFSKCEESFLLPSTLILIFVCSERVNQCNIILFGIAFSLLWRALKHIARVLIRCCDTDDGYLGNVTPSGPGEFYVKLS